MANLRALSLICFPLAASFAFSQGPPTPTPPTPPASGVIAPILPTPNPNPPTPTPPTPTPPKPTPAKLTPEDEIRKAAAAWITAATTKGLPGWVSFYTADAVVMPPNEPVADTPTKVHKAIAEIYATPGLTALSWQPTKVEVAKSGDFGCTLGWYKIVVKNQKGQLVQAEGKDVELWRKQANGQWLVFSHAWNTNAPAPRTVVLKKKKPNQGGGSASGPARQPGGQGQPGLGDPNDYAAEDDGGAKGGASGGGASSGGAMGGVPPSSGTPTPPKPPAE